MINQNNYEYNYYERTYPNVQSKKQRQSSMIAEQKYNIFGPNFYSELSSSYKQKKNRR